jgi:hypothetical protein
VADGGPPFCFIGGARITSEERTWLTFDFRPDGQVIVHDRTSEDITYHYSTACFGDGERLTDCETTGARIDALAAGLVDVRYDPYTCTLNANTECDCSSTRHVDITDLGTWSRPEDGVLMMQLPGDLTPDRYTYCVEGDRLAYGYSDGDYRISLHRPE